MSDDLRFGAVVFLKGELIPMHVSFWELIRP